VIKLLFGVSVWSLFAANSLLAQEKPTDEQYQRILPILQQQRNSAYDSVALCSADIADLQKQIEDLKKQIGASEKPKLR
jgi:hypothetical protein